ncbi:uncharacterized protein [Apostichopus japonicus]|uniref:uncharacterized protein n=1 Tax=Stichopus japonicus TaxID=307972 RepID=UPI003AB64E07
MLVHEMNVESNLNGRSLPFALDDPTGDPKHLRHHISAAIRHSLTTNGTDTIEDVQRQLPRPTESSNHHVSYWNKGCNHHNYPQQQLVVPELFTLNAIDDYNYEDIDDVSDEEIDTNSVIDMSEYYNIIGVGARNTGKIIKLTATNYLLANKNRQRILPENNQKEETPKGTFADNDENLTTTASPLAIENNTTEKSCDMIFSV